MTDNSLTTLKVIIFGSSSVGKTCLLRQLVDNEFSPTKATLIPDIKTKIYNYEGKAVKLALWDTAGSERFHSLPSNLYRNLQGAVFVYDVSNYDSFRELDRWMSNLEQFYEDSDKHPVIIVLGNKIDLEVREVSRQDGKNFAKRHAALFLETSAKTNDGVERAFDDLVTKIMETPGLWKSNIDSNSIVCIDQNQFIGHSWYQYCGQC